MRKKILSLLIAVCLLVTIFSIPGTKAYAAISGNSVKNTALNYVNTKFSPRGYCLKFVGNVYKKAGASLPGNNCCAYSFGNQYRKSTSKSNIPIGAWVYFSKSGIYPCGNHYAGHIGIYVGNGEIVHTWGGGVYSNGNTFSYIRKTTINEVINNGYKYCGWGIPSGVTYTTSWQSSLKAKNYASSGKTVLSWNSYSGASKYYVYRRKASSKRYTKIATTKSKTYVDKTATNGTYYYYYVKAVSKSGKTLKISSKISRTCDLARPLLKSITCIPSSGAIKISFKGVKNANRYKIYRATSKNGKYSCIYTIKRKKTDKGGESLSFTNKSTTPGKTYYYKIRAVTSKNIGADSATKYCYRTRDLARPVVKAKTRSDGKIVLSWGKIKYADKYYIYRAVKGGKYSKIATVTSTSYTNSTSLKNGTTYYYKVKAIDSNKSAANSATSVAVSKKYENKVIGFVSESTYKSKYKNSKKYSAKPYYRYKTRSVQTTTSTSSSLSGWTLISKSTNYKYGSWTTTKPSSNYESKSVYYYYAYVCNCRKMYWKSSNSDTCSNCNTKMTNILKVYSSNNPSLYYKKDTDGSYFTPKTLDKSNPGKLGTIYYMTYNGNSISKFISTSSKNTSFLWPSSSLRTIVYRTKTPTTIYKYQKYGSWSNWSNWTSTYKANSTTQKRDTTTKYYILKK